LRLPSRLNGWRPRFRGWFRLIGVKWLMRYASRTVPAFVRLTMSAICLSLSVASAFSAPQNSPFDLSGTIHEASKGKFTVDSGQGIFFHVVYDDKTAIVRADGTAGSAEDLKVGATVHVAGDLSETGEVKASRIEMVGETKKQPTSAGTAGPSWAGAAEIRTNLECHSESVRWRVAR
jgi:hypothetical protein